jgi:hypothetical protein
VHFLHKNEEAEEVERELMNPSFVCSSFTAKPIMSSEKAYSVLVNGERVMQFVMEKCLKRAYDFNHA